MLVTTRQEDGDEEITLACSEGEVHKTPSLSFCALSGMAIGLANLRLSLTDADDTGLGDVEGLLQEPGGPWEELTKEFGDFDTEGRSSGLC